MRTRNKLIISAIVGTFVLTVLGVVLVLNIASFAPQVNKPLETESQVGDPVFMRTVSHLMGQPFTEGNQVEALHNGDEIFPAMLDAIRGARETVNFETFVYWTGSIAVEFAEALAERARSGVQVRVLLDAIGASSMDPQLVELMRRSGALVEYFRPLEWYNLNRANNRTHRKLLIVDGRIGFTGGVGIGDEWLGDAQDSEHWRDSHFELRGPVVAQLQAGFADHWLLAHQEVLQGTEFFPKLEPAGEVLAQAFNSDAEGDAGNIRTLFLLSIAGARESIRISTPYFVPDDFLLWTLVNAAERGVEIEIVTIGRVTDSYLAKGAGRAKWGPLLEAGARFYRFEPTLYHPKMLIVDDRWVSIGSANFDNRSFLYNDENNVNILDAAFAAHLIAQFEQDKAESVRITLEEWRERPLRERLMEWWAQLFESQV